MNYDKEYVVLLNNASYYVRCSHNIPLNIQKISFMFGFTHDWLSVSGISNGVDMNYVTKTQSRRKGRQFIWLKVK